MPSITTPNMGLILPGIGTEPSPTWAQDQQISGFTIDGHNHSPGSGVPVPSSGLNINADLPFNNNNALSLRSVRFIPQSSPISQPTDLDCVYVSGVDLYYNDGNGNIIRLTQNGSPAGTSGSITNLTSPASVTYVSATPAFVFQSAASTPANLDAGSLTIRNIVANSNGIQINAPSMLAANYSLTLPTALPSAQAFMTLDQAGNIAAPIAFNGGITGSNLVNNINLPGDSVQANGLNVVVAFVNNSEPNLSVFRANFNSSGNVVSGEGVSSVVHPSPGKYTITLSTPFEDLPAIVLTPTGELNECIMSWTEFSGNQIFEIWAWDADIGAPNDTGFSMVAIGQRSS